MEKQLSTFNKLNDLEKLKTYVQNLNIDKLSSDLEEICLKEDGSVILQILFRGFSNTPKCQEKRARISTEILSNIQNKLISQRLSNKLISVLASEVENLSTSHLVTLTNSCLQMMQSRQEEDGSTCWKDLIPKLLNIIVEKDAVEHEGTRMTGVEYKGEVLTAICLRDWPGHMISNIASMFIDMPLTAEEHLKVVNKLCKSIWKIKLDEIPPLVHQILQLTKERNSMPLFVALADFFDSSLYNHINCDDSISVSQIVPEDGIPLKELQIVEGTILYHISNGLTSGPQSVKDFLKMLTNCLHQPQFVLRPFFATLLLNVSCISYTFEQEVSNIFKSAILRSVSEEEKIIESAWLESVVPITVNVQRILDKVIQNCYRDRDGVLKGIVSLAFSLLEIPKTRGKELQCERIWKLGSTLLVNLVQKYPHVTENVFQNLVNQISQVQESTQYTDCLTRIANKRPLSLLDCSSVVMQLLGNICARLPGIFGQRVIAAMLPLTKMSPSLRDNFIIFFRKALFGDNSSREVAVYGFLELLKDLKITDVRSLSQSMSQNYVGITQIYSGSFNSTAGAASNEGMCLEILSILRQVFEYHQQVKIVLYKGVYDCFHSNPKLGIHIVDNLKSQLDKFYLNNETPPIDFQKVVVQQCSSVVVQEPIAYLIFGLAQIAIKIQDDYSGSANFNEILDSLCERMADSDVTHFGFEKEASSSFLDELPENQLKQERIRQILGVYEALMGYVLCAWKQNSLECGRKLNALFKAYSRLSDYAKSCGKVEKKKLEDKKSSQKEPKETSRLKDKTKTTFKYPPTILNLKCASRLLTILNGLQVSWASEDSTELVKGKRDLHRYAFNVTLELISQARQLSPSELMRSKFMLQYVSYVGKVLYLRCISRLSTVKAFEGHCAILSLECFSELLNLVCHHFKPKLPLFLTEIGVAEKELKFQLKSVIDAILEQLLELLNEESEDIEAKEDTQTKKLLLHLISIVSFLVGHLERGGPCLQQVLNKIRLLCKDTKIQNPNVAKALLSLLLNVYLKFKASGSLMIDLVLCLCKTMPLIDDEMEIDKHETYEIINDKTANNCLLVICEGVRFMVNEVEWMISRFKAELSVLSFPSEEPLESRQSTLEENEAEMCRHLNFCVRILSIISTIAVPPGPFADAVLKEIGNIYNKLVVVTKYFILKVTKYHQPLQNTRFEKTIKLADHELAKNMYCFTEHIIADGAASTDDPPLKKQKKDAAALRNKVLKETKIIPKVIYEKEQFQKFVLQLSIKSKVTIEMKHTMARDYRLYAKKVKEIIEKENIHLEDAVMEVDESQDDSTQDGSTQASKKPRTEE